MSPTYISTVDTAKMIRAALKVAFPATKFSVRKGTGTGSSWLSVSWEDGPTDRMVDDVTINYQGSYYTGDDSVYETLPTQLVSFNDAEMPVEVQYSCVGVNTHRTMSDDGEKAALKVLSVNNPDVDIATAFGSVKDSFNSPLVQCLNSGDYWLSRPWDLGQAVHQIWSQINFSKIAVKK